MTRSPADSLDTVDSAPTGETVPNEALLGALAKAGVEIDAFIADVAAADLRRLRRDPNLPAVRFVEDLFPETSIFKSAIYALGPRELESIVCVNRQFKNECYDARLLTGRACMALTGQDCEQTAAEARKWYRVCADMHGTREAFAMLGAIANEGGASSVIMEMISSLGEAAKDLDESERCLRAAIAADPPELVAALSEFTQFPGDETATLDALAALGVGVGAHSSSDDDSDSDGQLE